MRNEPGVIVRDRCHAFVEVGARHRPDAHAGSLATDQPDPQDGVVRRALVVGKPRHLAVLLHDVEAVLTVDARGVSDHRTVRETDLDVRTLASERHLLDRTVHLERNGHLAERRLEQVRAVREQLAQQRQHQLGGLEDRVERLDNREVTVVDHGHHRLRERRRTTLLGMDQDPLPGVQHEHHLDRGVHEGLDQLAGLGRRELEPLVVELRSEDELALVGAVVRQRDVGVEVDQDGLEAGLECSVAHERGVTEVLTTVERLADVQRGDVDRHVRVEPAGLPLVDQVLECVAELLGSAGDVPLLLLPVQPVPLRHRRLRQRAGSLGVVLEELDAAVGQHHDVDPAEQRRRVRTPTAGDGRGDSRREPHLESLGVVADRVERLLVHAVDLFGRGLQLLDLVGAEDERGRVIPVRDAVNRVVRHSVSRHQRRPIRAGRVLTVVHVCSFDWAANAACFLSTA